MQQVHGATKLQEYALKIPYLNVHKELGLMITLIYANKIVLALQQAPMVIIRRKNV